MKIFDALRTTCTTAAVSAAAAPLYDNDPHGMALKGLAVGASLAAAQAARGKGKNTDADRSPKRR